MTTILLTAAIFGIVAFVASGIVHVATGGR